MTVTLSQKHIDEGVPKDCFNGPAARAVQEATGKRVAVCRHCIIIEPEDYFWDERIKIPE